MFINIPIGCQLSIKMNTIHIYIGVNTPEEITGMREHAHNFKVFLFFPDRTAKKMWNL